MTWDTEHPTAGIIPQHLIDVGIGGVISISKTLLDDHDVLRQAISEAFNRRFFVSDKQRLLEEALEIVTGPRQQLYGRPSQNFIDTAEIATGYLHARGLIPPDKKLESYDVAVLVNCLKIARIATSPEHKDHWVDTAGYAACGWEAVVDLMKQEKEEHPVRMMDSEYEQALRVREHLNLCDQWDYDEEDEDAVYWCSLARSHDGGHRFDQVMAVPDGMMLSPDGIERGEAAGPILCGSKLYPAPDKPGILCTKEQGHDGVHSWHSTWEESYQNARREE